MFNFIKMLTQACLILSFLSLFSSCTYSSEENNSLDEKYPAVSLMSTEKRIFHSEIINDDFEIYVSLPYKYSMSDTTYPVLYCLDANVKFSLISSVVNNLGTLTKELPEIIVVGIAYPIKDLADWVVGRNRDYTPTKNEDTEKYWKERLSKATGRNDIVLETGHGDKFLDFIGEELIPFIESNYRVSLNDRALHGTSLGGLFTIYTLLKHPELFQRYFASSPSINWEENLIYKLEEELAASHNDLPVNLFMCVGGLEREYYIKNMKKMSELLRSRNYPNLNLETHVFENETHGTTVYASVGRGLKILFKK
jgi:predicted alpha/beta superfamily hydrolase